VSAPPARFRIGWAIAGQIVGLLLALALTFVSMTQLRINTRRMDQLIDREAADVVQFQRLISLSERTGRTGQKFLLTGQPELVEETRATRREMAQVLADLAGRAEGVPARTAMAEVARLSNTYYERLERAIEERELGDRAAVTIVEQEVQPAREALDAALSAATSLEVRDLSDARRRAADETGDAYSLLLGGAALAVAIGVLMTVLLIRNLMALARSRSELAATLTLLEQRNDDLDAFAGRVAHDLRNILSPLPILAVQLRAVRNRPDDVAAVTERVARAGVRATGFLDTLLAFARSGRSVSDPHVGAPVRAAVTGALDSLGGLREQIGAEVETDLEDASVACAPALLLAVTTNLLSNALKFLEGRPVRRVRVVARRRDSSCHISVEDTGPGIAPEHQPRLFEPFYRTPGARAPGSGLGLATVHRIVEAAGGSISVASRVDEGTRFSVVLPAVALGAAATPRPVEPARSADEPSGLAPS
jgi:signal transduction histidine kinase